MKFISMLALTSSVFIMISFIYSFILNLPLYQLTMVGYRYINFVSVISIVVHLISVYKDRDRRILVFFSSAIPLAVLSSFVIGFIGWLFGGI